MKKYNKHVFTRVHNTGFPCYLIFHLFDCYKLIAYWSLLFDVCARLTDRLNEHIVRNSEHSLPYGDIINKNTTSDSSFLDCEIIVYIRPSSHPLKLIPTVYSVAFLLSTPVVQCLCFNHFTAADTIRCLSLALSQRCWHCMVSAKSDFLSAVQTVRCFHYKKLFTDRL